MHYSPKSNSTDDTTEVILEKNVFFTKLAWPTEKPGESESLIKLHALLHEKLVLPSNHIYHKNTEDLLRRHPEVAELGLVHFAFDPKYEDFLDYFRDNDREKKAGRDLSEYAKFLEDLDVSKTEYSASTPGKILTKIAFDQLCSAGSALSKSAKITDLQQRDVTSRLQDAGLKNDGIIHYPVLLKILSKSFDDKQLALLLRFASLARLMAGAASKNCANMIPQENLVDWCLVDPSGEDMILSDEIIFWEVFLEELLSATSGLSAMTDLQSFSRQGMDRVSFNDIGELRSESGFLQFTQKFSSIVDESARLHNVGSHQSGLVGFDDLISLREEISLGFREQIKGEVSLFSGIKMVETLLRVPFQLYGGGLQALESLVSFMALTQSNDHDWKMMIGNKIKTAEKARDYATRRYLGEPVLIDFLDQVVQRAKKNWHL